MTIETVRLLLRQFREYYFRQAKASILFLLHQRPTKYLQKTTWPYTMLWL